jgi:hypothetical protein
MKKILFVLSTLVLSIIATAGTSYAAQQRLYLTGSGKIMQGDTMVLTVVENSGRTVVNAVQANIAYPADKFEFISVESTPAFTVEAESYSEAGYIRIARGAQPEVSGVQAVAKIHLRVVGTGSASIHFSDGSAVVRSDDNTDILNGAFSSFNCKLSRPQATSSVSTPELATQPSTVPLSDNAASDTPRSAAAPPPAPKPQSQTHTTHWEDLLGESRILMPSAISWPQSRH